MTALGFVARHTRELDPAVLTDLATRYNPAALASALAQYQKCVPSVDKRCKRRGDGHLRNFLDALTAWAVDAS